MIDPIYWDTAKGRRTWHSSTAHSVAQVKKRVKMAAKILLLFADTMGRILGRPGELESGIVTALIGAPVFIIIIRKAKVKSL